VPAGIDRTAYSKAVVADYDNDGYVDFCVSNLNGDNFLYHNNHDGTFSEVAAQAGVQKPWQSFPAKSGRDRNEVQNDDAEDAKPIEIEALSESRLSHRSARRPTR
jgi:hypothetical protein